MWCYWKIMNHWDGTSNSASSHRTIVDDFPATAQREAELCAAVCLCAEDADPAQ